MDRCWRQQCPDSFRQLLPPFFPPVLLSSLPLSPLTDVATPPPPLSFLWAQPVLTLNICPGGACSGLESGVGVKKKSRVGLKHTYTFSVCHYVCTHTPVWAEVEDWFILFLSQQDENTNIQQGERKQFTDRSVALFMKIS